MGNGILDQHALKWPFPFQASNDFCTMLCFWPWWEQIGNWI